jgi:hypothetical protein
MRDMHHETDEFRNVNFNFHLQCAEYYIRRQMQLVYLPSHAVPGNDVYCHVCYFYSFASTGSAHN